MILDQIKASIGIEPDETVYDDQIELLLQGAVTRLKAAGLSKFIIGMDGQRNVTVGDFIVGQDKVGGLSTSHTIPTALEYFTVYCERRLYQEAQTSFYATLHDLENELLTMLTYGAL